MTTTARNATAEASVTMVRAATIRAGMPRAAMPHGPMTPAATTASSDRPSHHVPGADVLLVLGQPAVAQQLDARHQASQRATDRRMENQRVTGRRMGSRLAIAVRVRSGQADLVRNAPVALTALGGRNVADAAIVQAPPELVEHRARARLETVVHRAAAIRVRAARIPGESASPS
jgi:hypothetical protein